MHTHLNMARKVRKHFRIKFVGILGSEIAYYFSEGCCPFNQNASLEYSFAVDERELPPYTQMQKHMYTTQ